MSVRSPERRNFIIERKNRRENRFRTIEKHPSPGTLEEDFITDEVDTLPHHDSIFDKINAATIRKAAMRTHGSHRPSGLDADEWRKILTNYGQYAIDLCKTIAQLAQRIAREKLTENHLEAYNACRLIPLDKCPGIRPIGIGEVLRRIIGRCISEDLQTIGDAAQLCLG